MITLENPRTYGWMDAIRGMRNPLDSWARTDSIDIGDPSLPVILGDNDRDLMWRLMNLGSNDHCKFRRMLSVYMDIEAPLYWWKEFSTYKVGTVENSCSTMHTITKRPFGLDMFAHDRMLKETLPVLEATVEALEKLRRRYLALTEDLKGGDPEDPENKKIQVERWYCWNSIIQLLPSSWMQRRTVFMNYEVLANMYHSRIHHKLREWKKFCWWCQDNLPYSWIFTGIPEDFRDNLPLIEVEDSVRERIRDARDRVLGLES